VNVGLLPWDSAVVGAAGTPSFDNAPSAPPVFVAKKVTGSRDDKGVCVAMGIGSAGSHTGAIGSCKGNVPWRVELLNGPRGKELQGLKPSSFATFCGTTEVVP
jgi:hypothetical protein